MTQLSRFPSSGAASPGDAGRALSTPDSPETLLVIDDNDGNRYAVARLLKAAGYDVLEAGTGREGLQLVFERRPDLVLLDIRLPDIMGWDVCRSIKTDAHTALIPVLHVSASFVTDRDRARGLEDGRGGGAATAPSTGVPSGTAPRWTP